MVAEAAPEELPLMAGSAGSDDVMAVRRLAGDARPWASASARSPRW
ncbi:hypothetical protein [Nonomuraea sp. NPDC003201]